jgi:hypothetical protein
MSSITAATNSDAAANSQLSDEELLKMANENPIEVQGKARHEFDDVFLAAKNGLIDINAPAEFERQLRFQIRQGSTEFADSWTADERWTYAQADDAEKADMTAAKWQEFRDTKYLDYLQGKASSWSDATRRMDAAANVGNMIGGATIVGVTALGAVAAAPVIAAAGEGVSTASLSLGARATTFAMTNPGWATAGTLGGMVAYGLVAPPGAPDLPGPGDDAGRSARTAISNAADSIPARNVDDYVVAFGRADSRPNYMQVAEQNTGLTAINIQDRINVSHGLGSHFPSSWQAEEVFATQARQGGLDPMFSGYMTQEVLEGGAAKMVHFDMRGIDLTPNLPNVRLADGSRALDSLPGFARADFHSSSEARQCVAHLASTGPGERSVSVFIQHADGVTLITPSSNVARGAPLPPDLAARMPNITWRP